MSIDHGILQAMHVDAILFVSHDLASTMSALLIIIVQPYLGISFQ